MCDVMRKKTIKKNLGDNFVYLQYLVYNIYGLVIKIVNGFFSNNYLIKSFYYIPDNTLLIRIKTQYFFFFFFGI